ncbi:hypothetical protein PoB_001339200 [Plakobranchus ocellatus]|uniref:Small EDRK-rich factor-like N-terminal domain-containing protein n=1 Tax=Plakobranchus ocellatus TaxID=259542 RepID=A0AAV3YXI1_9GAST|nr:hypothetical protein PoB_001339200 [Plakobranchus ocellatus]
MSKASKNRKRLHEQIAQEQQAQPRSKTSKEKSHVKDDKYVDAKLSKKILAQARRQGEDLQREIEGTSHRSKSSTGGTNSHRTAPLPLLLIRVGLATHHVTALVSATPPHPPPLRKHPLYFARTNPHSLRRVPVSFIFGGGD